VSDLPPEVQALIADLPIGIPAILGGVLAGYETDIADLAEKMNTVEDPELLRDATLGISNTMGMISTLVPLFQAVAHAATYVEDNVTAIRYIIDNGRKQPCDCGCDEEG
jgi:hypothetical protein